MVQIEIESGTLRNNTNDYSGFCTTSGGFEGAAGLRFSCQGRLGS